MEINSQTVFNSEEENGFSFKQLIISCLANWKWFVLSLIICLGLGSYYYLRQQPVYARSMLLLIQDDNSSSGLSMPSAFKDFGFGGPSTNVYNEMVSLTSPAVMFEVVDRLQLYVNVQEVRFPHEIDLYKGSCPFDFNWPDKTPLSNAKFEMELNPDDTYTLSNFSYIPPKAKKAVTFDKTVKGKIGFNTVSTPVGIFEFRPNGLYTNNRTEPVRIKVKIVPDKRAVEKYLAKVGADLENVDADVIELTISDVNVTRAENILETIVDVYNEFWVRDKNRMAVATAKFIDERLNNIVRELNDVDGEIAEYQKDHLIIDLELNARKAVDESTAVNRTYLDVSNQLAMAKYIRDYISNPSNSSTVVPINTGTGSNALEQQIAQYNTLVLTMENLKDNSGASNPIVQDYERQTRGMREGLLKAVNAQVGALESTLKNLNNAMGQNKSELSTAPAQAQYLGTIKRDQAVKENLYLFLLEKREENNLTQAFNAYNTRIIDPPFGPTKQVSPNKVVILAVSFLLGLMIPMLIIYIKTLADNKVRTRSDFENLPIPFAGEIPFIGKKKWLRNLFMSTKKKRKEIDTPRPIVEEGKRDVANEAFRVVRSNIDLMLGRNHAHSVLMVTSFNPGSGKSFLTYNLGASFALKKKRVLLIDGDLRHGSLSAYVGSPSRGLAAYLSGNVSDIQRIVYPVEKVKNLSIIPIGKRPPNPAELLESDLFEQLINKVKEEYDIVLVDCPPVNIVVDTQIINHYGDATIFVVRAGLLNRSAIKDLFHLHKENKLKRMSLILNGVENAQSSYFVYGNYQSIED